MKVAIYCRLSEEDKNKLSKEDDSESIQNQKSMLIEYAVKKLHVPLLILLGHDDCGVMTYANEHYPEMTENFQSILKCVYPVIDHAGQLDCNNKFARKHTLWVEDYLTKNSSIINSAVTEGSLYIAKCHFDHDSGEVYLIDNDLHRI